MVWIVRNTDAATGFPSAALRLYPTCICITGLSFANASSTVFPSSSNFAANYKAAWWNYRWSADYGSERWKVSDPKATGQDEFAPSAAKLLDDGKTVELAFAKLRPVMQMQVGYNLKAADGKPVAGSVFLTIHITGK